VKHRLGFHVFEAALDGRANASRKPLIKNANAIRRINYDHYTQLMKENEK